MSQAFNPFGLVLSGGGARGAYEVGVARYLADQRMAPSAYAGASIGALNAVFLAEASSFTAGVKRLENIWFSLKSDEVMKVNYQSIILGFMNSAMKKYALTHPHLALFNDLLKLLSEKSGMLNHAEATRRTIYENPLYRKLKEGLLDNGFLQNLLEGELGLGNLEASPPIWISAYKSQGTMEDIVAYVLSGLGMKDTADSDYFLLNSLPQPQRLSIVLASAAIPVAYGSEIVEGQRYVDGGLGGAMTSRGNTPITPLVQAGCKHCIVVNLSDGSFFNRHEFPDTNIIEIRPEKSLHPDGLFSSLFDFRRDRISALIEQGYSDAERCVGNAARALQLVRERGKSAAERDESILRLNGDGFDSAMRLLESD